MKRRLVFVALTVLGTAVLAFVSSPKLPETMKRVSQFSFDKKLLGDGAKSADAIGVAFPGGKVNGNAKNVKLRFDASYIKLVQEKRRK